MPKSNRETVYIDEHFCQFRYQLYTESWKKIREDINECVIKETGTPNYNGLICPLCNNHLLL